MLAKTLGVRCSRKCELVLALSYVKAREELLRIAYRLAADADTSALRLARRIQELPVTVADELAKQTLRRAGFEAWE